MTVKDVLNRSGMNMRQFSAYFKIPYRTIQDWCAGRSCPADYFIILLDNAINKNNLKSFVVISKATGKIVEANKLHVGHKTNKDDKFAVTADGKILWISLNGTWEELDPKQFKIKFVE